MSKQHSILVRMIANGELAEASEVIQQHLSDRTSKYISSMRCVVVSEGREANRHEATKEQIEALAATIGIQYFYDAEGVFTISNDNSPELVDQFLQAMNWNDKVFDDDNSDYNKYLESVSEGRLDVRSLILQMDGLGYDDQTASAVVDAVGVGKVTVKVLTRALVTSGISKSDVATIVGDSLSEVLLKRTKPSDKLKRRGEYRKNKVKIKMASKIRRKTSAFKKYKKKAEKKKRLGRTTTGKRITRRA